MVEIRYYRIDRYQNRAKLLTESYNNVARRRLLDKIYIYIYLSNLVELSLGEERRLDRWSGVGRKFMLRICRSNESNDL